MRLVYKKLNFEISFSENKSVVCFIENHKEFSVFLQGFVEQLNGDGEGDLLLSDGTDSVDILKKCAIIFNPLCLDCNNKKILSSLFKELSGYSNDFFAEKIAEINSLIINYFDNLQEKSYYPLSFNLEVQPTDLFKIYNVQIAVDNSDSVLEKIIEYLRVNNEICGLTMFVFVNLKSYLSEEELKELYKYCFYAKIFLLLVESHYQPILEDEDGWIIDKDLCIIKCS